MASTIDPSVVSSVVAATTPASSTSSSSSSSSSNNTIAGNFTEFLQLLTTQLKNQNPLDPLDTNQFTQQLVEFAQVEQQLKSNDELSTLVTLQQTAQQTQALGFVGSTVTVDGSTTALKNGSASWSFNMPKPATAQFTITDSTGQTVYSASGTAQAGLQTFPWDGHDTNGKQLPDGNYKLSITAVDASGQTVAVSPEVQGVVDSVDLTQTPPLLSIGGQNFTINQIKGISRPGA